MPRRWVFIDLGVKRGDTLDIAVAQFPECELYIGFEPVPRLFRTATTHFSGYTERIEIYNCAVDVFDDFPKEVKMYVDQNPDPKAGGGSTLLEGKTTGDLQPEVVACVDIGRFLADHTKRTDRIILKINIEGKEYDLLEGMLDRNLLRQVEAIYCAWHWGRINSLDKKRHDDLLLRLRGYGFPLTGNDNDDEFLRLAAKDRLREKFRNG